MAHGVKADFLTRAEARALSKKLKAHGLKLPKRGWCHRLGPEFSHREVCGYGQGKYLLIGSRKYR